MKNRFPIIVAAAVLFFVLACQIGGKPTQSVAPVASMEPTMQLTPPTREATGTPIIISPTANEQVNPTVDPKVFETIVPTQTACEQFNSYVYSHSVAEIVAFMETGGMVVQIPNGKQVPAGMIYWTKQKSLKVNYMLAETLKQDMDGTVLRMLQPTTFKVSGWYKEDPCEKK